MKRLGWARGTPRHHPETCETSHLVIVPPGSHRRAACSPLVRYADLITDEPLDTASKKCRACAEVEKRQKRFEADGVKGRFVGKMRA